MIQVVGVEAGGTIMDVVSNFTGNWMSAPSGKFSTVGIPAGSTLTRSGGIVTTTQPFTDQILPIDTASIIITNAVDPTYNGTFVVSLAPTGVITWTNAGANGSTTTTAGSFVKSGAQQANAMVLYPAARIVQANNPVTKALDGTVVIDANQITFAFNDSIQAGAGDENAMYHSFNQISLVGAPSPGAHQGNENVEWDNPCDQCAEEQMNVVANLSDYAGAGGTRIPSIHHTTITGPAIFADYVNVPGPNSGVEFYAGCGVRQCNNTFAGYITRSYAGDGFNTLTYLESIAWGTTNNVVRQWGNSSETFGVKSIKESTNDGVATVVTVTKDSTVGITDDMADNNIAEATRTTTTVGGAQIHDQTRDLVGVHTSNYTQTPTGFSWDQPGAHSALDTFGGQLPCLANGANCQAAPAGIPMFGTPASSTAACSVPQVEYDASFLYTCVATNTWRRVATATF
jgi:hypothetical protein